MNDSMKLYIFQIDVIFPKSCLKMDLNLFSFSCCSVIWFPTAAMSDMRCPFSDNEMYSEQIKATLEKPAEIRNTVPMKESLVA